MFLQKESPRKRPRKNSAPQRADLGGGTGTGSGGGGELGDSSNGETSGPYGATDMAWEDGNGDGGGHTSLMELGRRH